MKKETTSTIPDCVSQRLWLLATALVFSANASAWDCTEGGHNIDINNPAYSDTCTYGIKPGTSMPTVPPETIGLNGTGSTVTWNRVLGTGCSAAPSGINCSGLTVKIPGYPGTAVLPTEKVELGGTAPITTGEYNFGLHVEDATSGVPATDRSYRFRVAGDGGGWGDPHITTVNGAHYDFQSVGEFVALRGNGIEIQTRQEPVPGANPPADSNTGLTMCPSIYTAVAARVGKYRVSYQQSANDPHVMELRVDGVIKTLSPNGINLESLVRSPQAALASKIETVPAKADLTERTQPRAVVRPHVFPVATKIGGRIVKPAQGDGIEIDYVDGTRLVVTQDWWDGPKKWYLNVNVYDTIGAQGIMGVIPQGSWLPALSDGQSLGQKPNAAHDRYVALYKTFADSWRVTDSTSLFDYVPGTSTKTFTNNNWPSETPGNCAVGNVTAAVQHVSQAVAAAQCSGIADESLRANCIFDVMATGYTGFVRSYLFKQRFERTPGITLQTIKDRVRPTELAKVVAMVERTPLAGMPTGMVQFYVDGKKFGSPVTLDATGKAVLNAANLPAGAHNIEAQYTSSGFGGRALTSRSRAISHRIMPVQPAIK